LLNYKTQCFQFRAIGKSIFLIFITSFIVGSLAHAQVNIPQTISIADTNSYGNLTLYDLNGWQFSFDNPEEVNSKRNLSNTIPVDLTDLNELKSNPKWKNHGWFEAEFIADSSIAGIPWILSYFGQEPVTIWLNGIEILKNGNVSDNPDEEVLSRYVNKVQTGVMFSPGSNFLLVQYSDHTNPTYFRTWKWFENGIYLVLYPDYEIFQRRHRAFIFGGALMLLSLLVLIHTYLAVKFKGQYHTYVSLTTFFMLLHAFTTLSDTMADWTYSYLYFAEFSYAVSFIFVVYFFLIALRRIFDLPIPRKPLAGILFISIIIGVISIFINRGWLNLLHPVLVAGTLIYGIYSLWEAKRKSSENKIWIIATGLALTVGGGLLYVLPYIAFGSQSHVLFIISILMAYTGIPIALTFNVASNYAALIETLEAKVQERTSDLEVANEFQNRFFANISHEFRTPLTIGEGLVNKLLRSEEVTHQDHQRDLSIVKRNLNRLHDMVDQIIDLTKADKHQLTLNRKYYYADSIVSVSVESFRSLAEYYGHTFTFLPDAKGVVLFADRSKVEVMINNLISNAIKFTPDGGYISIQTSLEEELFVVSVQDSGPGIPEHEQEAIFERFHRIKREETEYIEGMGVGLELSRTLARIHNGELSIDADVKNGACFRLELPVSKEKEKEVATVEDALEEDQLYPAKPVVETESEYSILLVEDNQDMREYVSNILSELGPVKEAENGEKAIELLSSSYTPDIIITDLMMPVMGGLELVEVLMKKPKWKDIPIIVLTAKALEEDKLHLLRIGVVDYITKPFVQEHLMLKTQNLLRYYQKKKALEITLSDKTLQSREKLSEKVMAYISKNIKDSSLSVESLAEKFSQSRSSLYRNIQLETGMTPAEFIREIRLVTARKLIEQDKTMRLEELANAVGYKSSTSFRKVYEERFGVHPLS